MIQGEWKGGIWKPHINNKKGNNQYTPKTELVGKSPHPFKLMNKEQQFEELKRLSAERRYHSSMSMKYAHKINFLMQIMGIEPKKSEADIRADRDFKEREGEMRYEKSNILCKSK